MAEMDLPADPYSEPLECTVYVSKFSIQQQCSIAIIKIYTTYNIYYPLQFVWFLVYFTINTHKCQYCNRNIVRAE